MSRFYICMFAEMSDQINNTQLPILPSYHTNEASIYIHIPFCRKACTYCNFHFSTSLQYKEDLVNAIVKEIGFRKNYLKGKRVATLYLGGGTPSVLNYNELSTIINEVKKYYELVDQLEITFEANPDDLTKEYLVMLQSLGVNRLSIGLQSFHEEELSWMNRSHNANQSIAILDVLEMMPEFDYSIDLIFGLPISNNDLWMQNLEILSHYRVPHISCYNLTVEPKTPLAHKVAHKLEPNIDDKVSEEQYLMTHEELIVLGYDHYEVSNYAKPGKYSKHNTGYWFGAHYLGIGPAAHSFNGKSRTWNVANNAKYMQGLASEELQLETEVLSETDRYNEVVMTSLRTMWGLDLSLGLSKEEMSLVDSFVYNNLAKITNDRLILTEQGRLHCDSISGQLFR